MQGMPVRLFFARFHCNEPEVTITTRRATELSRQSSPSTTSNDTSAVAEDEDKGASSVPTKWNILKNVRKAAGVLVDHSSPCLLSENKKSVITRGQTISSHILIDYDNHTL